MCEMMHKQNSAVLEQLERQRNYTEEQLKDISWTISKAHKATIRRVNSYFDQEFERVEREIAQLEQQLIAKIAERSELRVWFQRIGYQDAIQDKIQSHLE